MADDEQMLTATLAEILEDEGYQVITAANGARALRLVRRHHPHLVFLDLHMPGMSGEDTCRRILALRPATTVVIFTAMASEEQIVRLRRMGARAVLLKPAPIPRLLAIAEEVCRPSGRTAILA